MAQTLTGSISIIPNLIYTNALTDGTPLSDAFTNAVSDTYTDGTGANKAQVLYNARRIQVGASAATEDLDLAGGLTLAEGAAFGTITFTKLKFIWIYNRTLTTAYTLNVGGDANSVPIFGAVGDYVTIGPGGQFFFSSPVDGVVVTAGTGDIIQIDNPSAGSITYDIIILGEGTIA